MVSKTSYLSFQNEIQFMKYVTTWLRGKICESNDKTDEREKKITFQNNLKLQWEMCKRAIWFRFITNAK